MTTVAQLYQPRRLIAVGNRQRRLFAPHYKAHGFVSIRTSTFPSLVGSFASRLEVGNRRPSLRITSRRNSPQCTANHLNEYQSQQQPHSCGYWWACPAAPCLMAAQHSATHRAAQRLNELRYPASSAFGPSAVGIFLPTVPLVPAARRYISQRSASHRISTNTCQAPVAFGQLAVRRNYRVPLQIASLRPASQRSDPLFISTHLNGRPSGRHPQLFVTEGFGMPSLVSNHDPRCCIAHHTASHLNAPTTTPNEETKMAYESTPERLEIRNRLVDAFIQVSVQGLITHQEIANIIGKRTTSPEAIKQSAFRIATDDHGLVFENIRGAGYRRIAAGEVHRVGTQTRNFIRGKAKRGSKKIVAVLASNSNSMTNNDRIKAHAELGILGMIKMAAGRGAASKAYAEAEKHHERHQKPPTQEEISRSVMRALTGKAA